MKKVFLVVACGLITVLFSSCMSEYTYTYRESTARYMELMRHGFITPVTADMEVQQERIENVVYLEVELKEKDINSIIASNNNGQESPIVMGWKKEALAQTAKKFKADDMVSPLFEIAPHPQKEGMLVVTVTGHPAIYKNYRPATKNDVELILPFLGQGNTMESNTNTTVR